MNWTEATAPDAADIEAMALAAVRCLARGVSRVRPAASRFGSRTSPVTQMLEDLGIDDPFELTGLYDGIPLTEKSGRDQPGQPDAIWLFRRAILDEWIGARRCRAVRSCGSCDDP